MVVKGFEVGVVYCFWYVEVEFFVVFCWYLLVE